MKVEPLGYESAERDKSRRAGWDLLIDYDHTRDVPGMMDGPEQFVDPGPPYKAGGFTCVTIREGPPDTERLRAILTKRLARASYDISGWEFGPSTNGWHLKIRLDPRPAPIESVALQAVCGSDPLRESCNVQRAREVERWAREIEEGGGDIGREAAAFWRTRWNVLYQPNPSRKKETP